MKQPTKRTRTVYTRKGVEQPKPEEKDGQRVAEVPFITGTSVNGIAYVSLSREPWEDDTA